MPIWAIVLVVSGIAVTVLLVTVNAVIEFKAERAGKRDVNRYPELLDINNKYRHIRDVFILIWFIGMVPNLAKTAGYSISKRYALLFLALQAIAVVGMLWTEIRRKHAIDRMLAAHNTAEI